MRRPAPPRELPPPLELECLKALWTIGEGNVHAVRRALSSRELAYTTVMTVLDRLARREAVVRRKVGRSFVYTPVLTRDTIRRLAVRELLDSFFSGSPQELLAFLSSDAAETQRAARAPEPALDTTLL